MPRRNPRRILAPSPRVRSDRKQWAISLVLVISIGLLIGAVWLVRGMSASVPAFASVTDCRGVPQFAPAYGFTGGVMANTSIPDRIGLVLLDPAQPGRGFQHPSWTQAGHIGPFTMDVAGNIYLGPVPRVSLADNPPDGANTIWRVDTVTGEMQPWITVPAAAPPNTRNPFGILGMAYDCDTNSIYVSSVAGSGPATEVGRLYQIDAISGDILSQADGIDALGITVIQTPTDKRLYFGNARESLLLSIGVDNRGRFVGEPQIEVDLADLGSEVNEKIRRITLTDDGRLELTVVPFTFTLAARSDDLQRVLVAVYDPETETWGPE